jgi:hypothetical protein
LAKSISQIWRFGDMSDGISIIQRTETKTDWHCISSFCRRWPDPAEDKLKLPLLPSDGQAFAVTVFFNDESPHPQAL